MLLGLIGLFSCSSDSNEIPEPELEAFDVSFTPSADFAYVDKAFSVQVTGTAKIHEIKQVFTHSSLSVGGDGMYGEIDPEFRTLHYQLPDVGVEKMDFIFTDVNGREIEKSFEVNVLPGDAVQITGMKINSFYNIHETYDPEFAEDDPNRLADIIFAFHKVYSRNFSTEENYNSMWFLSEVYPNEQQLEFDLTDKDLYIAPYARFDLGIGDHDEDGLGEDLARDPSQMNVNLYFLQQEKPSEVHIIKEDANVDITIFLKWPEEQ